MNHREILQLLLNGAKLYVGDDYVVLRENDLVNSNGNKVDALIGLEQFKFGYSREEMNSSFQEAITHMLDNGRAYAESSNIYYILGDNLRIIGGGFPIISDLKGMWKCI